MPPIVSLVTIIVGGAKAKEYHSHGIWAAVCLAAMFIGAFGTMPAPRAVFGIFARFSVFSAAAFKAVLGVYLFRGFDQSEKSP